MSEVVLDASALLVLVNGEAGSEVVKKKIRGAAMSAVNLSEVIAKLTDRGMPPNIARSALLGLGFVVHPFDEEMALVAASLRPATRSVGLSFGDRACLALARTLGKPALTADRDWKRCRLSIQVELIR